MSTLKPFFCFYGGKWRAAPKYPAPQYQTIIEPFAGAAGYSIRHAGKNVILIDKDPVIVGVWKFLIKASEKEILNLPARVENVSDLPVPQEAKWLIGFWLNKGTASPCKTPSKWMREGSNSSSFWGEKIRERIARQVNSISHWKVFEGSYHEFNIDREATWFIDPPYQQAGVHYRCSSSDINFSHLAKWCKKRKGQVIACENDGAEWLPFVRFADIQASPSKRGGKISKEVIWERHNVKFDENKTLPSAPPAKTKDQLSLFP